MDKCYKFLTNYIKAIAGGIMIGLGGTVFLSVDDKVFGAFMFSLGLLAICVTQQLLFTGKASYTSDVPYLLTILLGNYLGATSIGDIISYIRPELHAKALSMCSTKLDNFSFANLIVAGILCNVLIYFAVEGFAKGHAELLIMCVMAFILCGFEHCVANMYYFAVARLYTPTAFLFLLCNVLANWCGGLIIQAFRFIEREDE